MRLPNQVTPSSIAPVGAALLLVAVIAFGGIDSRPAAGAAEDRHEHRRREAETRFRACLLYTSDAADE